MHRAQKILVVHESYSQRGGEDEVVETDCDLLTQHGHTVIPWRVHNAPLLEWSAPRKATLLVRTAWSRQANHQMRRLCARHNPDIVHIHNTLPLLSPSVIRAAHRAHVPVVMTLHNYRLMCPVGTCFRDGAICEDCVTRSLLQGVIHACYRGSRVQTAAVAVMLATHRQLGTWTECVDMYIALTKFMRSKFIAQGLPPERIAVRSSPVISPMIEARRRGSFALFVGRLSEEKGIRCLLDACRLMKSIPVKILGGGPLEPLVRSALANGATGIEYLGQLPHTETMEQIAQAGVLLFPSLWYEGLPRTILESLACGVPVVASRLGSVAEILTDGRDAFLVHPGDASALADRVARIMTNETLRRDMGRAARDTYLERYTMEIGYRGLLDVYESAIAGAQARGQGGRASGC